MKIIKRIVIALLLVFLLFLAAGIAIGYFYEDAAKQYLIGELNKNLNSKVIVDSKNINLFVLRSFPYASIEFNDVKVLDYVDYSRSQYKKEKKLICQPDTLFSVKTISFQFNIINLISGNYHIKKIKAVDGILKLKVNKFGDKNWDIWKETNDTLISDSSKSIFALEKVFFKNIQTFYIDEKNMNDVMLTVRDGTLSGEFYSDEYSLETDGDMFVDYFKSDSINFLNKKSVKVDLDILVDNKKDVYQFTKGALQISGIKIAITGKYIVNNKSDYADLLLKGKDMDVQSVLSLLPEKYHKKIECYESDGIFYFNASVKGEWNDYHYPDLKADFGINEADIIQQSSGIALRKVNLSGIYFSNSNQNLLNVKTFSAMLGNGNISGNFRMEDFSNPHLYASAEANLSFSDMRQLLKIDSLWNYPIETLTGELKMKGTFDGRIKDLRKISKNADNKMILFGNMDIINTKLKIKNPSLSFDSINGSFLFNNNDIVINSFSGQTAKSDFFLKGSVINILAYTFLENEDITIDASFHSDNLNLNELLTSEQTSSDTIYKINFSPSLNFNLISEIGHLEFRKFDANNISGTFQLRNQKLIIDPISFHTMDGSITASGMVDEIHSDTLLITCDAKLIKININKLFNQFENFGQSVITQNHLRGIVTADVQFASVWKSDLSVDLNRIYTRSNLLIEKGELIQFKPMKNLSRFIEVSELEHIKFSTLQNQIEIKEQKIFIPKMDIHSSAMDITLSGVHTFNNDIDYRIKVLLSELLSKKARKAKKENEEFGVVEDDKSEKMNLFLSMTGTVNNPIIKYDRQGVKEKMKQDIALEKQTLKQILKDEFGWFKKDTSLIIKGKQKKDEEKFIIKWDEEKEEQKNKDEDY
ncbi:MAG: AsmA-like C-terminal region-containing protein [Bacteroidota bacterium]